MVKVLFQIYFALCALDEKMKAKDVKGIDCSSS